MPNPDNITLLTTHHLSVGYNGQDSLFRDLNLSLAGGELVCFMGPNGIGKSTLIRTLAGLQKPLSGTVTYGKPGETKTTDRDDIPKKVAVVLTDKVNAINLTVQELVTYGRYPHLPWSLTLTEEDKRIIEQSIQSLHINHLLSKKLFELSDGQLQMAMIARALAQDCEIILLDEPTAHLDLNNRLEIMNLLRKIVRESNRAILVSTHELDLTLQTADRIWLSGNDQNMLTGTPEDLVLDGSLDSIFQFKGFDLKTGKVKQEVYRKLRVNLTGQGHEYLWTRNALQRSGYEIVVSNYQCEIKVVVTDRKVTWQIHSAESSGSVDTINRLLQHLQLLA